MFRPFPFFKKHSILTNLSEMKFMKILIIFLVLTLRAYSPEPRMLSIIESEAIRPYEAIWNATCLVESGNNPLAFLLEKNGNISLGIAQISQGKVTDFNNATGKNYEHIDMYDPIKSKEVFMWHASKYNPNDTESIARSWNGSGPMTIEYWKLIQAKL